MFKIQIYTKNHKKIMAYNHPVNIGELILMHQCHLWIPEYPRNIMELCIIYLLMIYIDATVYIGNHHVHASSEPRTRLSIFAVSCAHGSQSILQPSWKMHDITSSVIILCTWRRQCLNL